MDIVGPLPTAQGNFKFAVVAVEYFTKWIEARTSRYHHLSNHQKILLAANHM
jgi:hypothetical protein